jgi:hypothetical protein
LHKVHLAGREEDTAKTIEDSEKAAWYVLRDIENRKAANDR